MMVPGRMIIIAYPTVLCLRENLVCPTPQTAFDPELVRVGLVHNYGHSIHMSTRENLSQYGQGIHTPRLRRRFTRSFLFVHDIFIFSGLFFVVVVRRGNCCRAIEAPDLIKLETKLMYQEDFLFDACLLCAHSGSRHEILETGIHEAIWFPRKVIDRSSAAHLLNRSRPFLSTQE